MLTCTVLMFLLEVVEFFECFKILRKVFFFFFLKMNFSYLNVCSYILECVKRNL